MPREPPHTPSGRTATFEAVEAELKRKLAASALEIESLKRDLLTSRSVSKAAALDAAAAIERSRERQADLETQLVAARKAAEEERARHREAMARINALQAELNTYREEAKTAVLEHQRAQQAKSRLEGELKAVQQQLDEARRQHASVPAPLPIPRPPSGVSTREHQQLQARLRLAEESLARAQVRPLLLDLLRSIDVAQHSMDSNIEDGIPTPP